MLATGRHGSPMTLGRPRGAPRQPPSALPHSTGGSKELARTRIDGRLTAPDTSAQGPRASVGSTCGVRMRQHGRLTRHGDRVGERERSLLMCGIAGLCAPGSRVTLGPWFADAVEEARHRGPDADGWWVPGMTAAAPLAAMAHQPPPKSAEVALGFLRLAILDLSPAGNQPMLSGDRLALVFNGEIYNYVELRAELAALGYAVTLHRRHGGDPPRLGRVGPRRARPLRGHVRHRALGSRSAAACSWRGTASARSPCSGRGTATGSRSPRR